MVGSTYSPNTWHEVEVAKVAFASVGIQQTVIANTITNIDVVLTDDVLIRAVELITQNSTFGDTITFKIIDSGNLLGFGTSFVVATVVNNYNVLVDDTCSMNYTSIVPKKALATMTLRVEYTSISLATNVDVAINYIMLKPTI